MCMVNMYSLGNSKIQGYKVLGSNGEARNGFRYDIGTTYLRKELDDHSFHFFLDPRRCFTASRFFDPTGTKCYRVEVGGQVGTGNEIAYLATEITVVKEIPWAELLQECEVFDENATLATLECFRVVPDLDEEPDDEEDDEEDDGGNAGVIPIVDGDAGDAEADPAPSQEAAPEPEAHADKPEEETSKNNAFAAFWMALPGSVQAEMLEHMSEEERALFRSFLK